jgi:glycosyltransferase involved in cell wall biosynthesis
LSIVGVAVRVLMLCSQITGEMGTFARSAALARQLDRRGHTVAIVTVSGTPRLGVRRRAIHAPLVLEVGGLAPRKVRQMGLDPSDLLTRLLALPRHVDIVHAFSYRPTAAVHAALLRQQGIPLLYDWADLVGRGGYASERRDLLGRLIGAFDDRLERAMVRGSDGVTAISSFLARRARRLGVDPQAVWILPPGVDVEAMPLVEQRKARAALGLAPDALIVGFAGFHRWDLDLVAGALIQLFPRYPRLSLVVGGPAGATIERHLGDRWRHRLVRFPALFGERYRDLLASADVLLLPYPRRRYNVARYPNKIGEYLAAGRAIVTNRTGDMGELLDRTGAALLVGESPEELAAGVARCLEDRDLRTTLGERGRSVAETAFGWDRVAERLEQAYQTTIARRSK